MGAVRSGPEHAHTERTPLRPTRNTQTATITERQGEAVTGRRTRGCGPLWAARTQVEMPPASLSPPSLAPGDARRRRPLPPPPPRFALTSRVAPPPRAAAAAPAAVAGPTQRKAVVAAAWRRARGSAAALPRGRLRRRNIRPRARCPRASWCVRRHAQIRIRCRQERAHTPSPNQLATSAAATHGHQRERNTAANHSSAAGAAIDATLHPF